MPTVAVDKAELFERLGREFSQFQLQSIYLAMAVDKESI
jgi:hypothetical protein